VYAGETPTGVLNSVSDEPFQQAGVVADPVELTE